MKFPERIYVFVPESDERRNRLEDAVFAALGGTQPQEAQPPELFPIGSIATTTQLAAGSVATTTDAVDAVGAQPPPPPPPPLPAPVELTVDGPPVPDHIHVAVPASDARRDRIERDVFAQLGAIRTAQRTDEFVALPVHERSWKPWLVGVGVAIAAAVATVVLVKRQPHPPYTAIFAPADIVTPVGATTKVTYGDAIVDAGSDTKVHASQGKDGTITLELDRGSVDCDVEPRSGRAPFRVVAGDVTVEVIGTRFTVIRRAAGVRVDVTRGKVKVRDPNGQYLVAAGETWPASLAGSDVPEDAATDAEEELEMPEMPVGTRKPAKRASTAPRDPTEAEYKQAVLLMNSDINAAERAFQALAKGNGKSARGALVWLSEIESDRGRTDGALAYLAEYDRRFPTSSEAEEVAYRRVEVLNKARRKAALKGAARQYLQRFPQGTYVEQVTDILRRR